MIADGRVFDVEAFVPQEVVHRHEEIGVLSAALEPLLDGERGDHTFCFGPSGVGKTCVARYVAEDLRRQLVDVTTAYVNCWEHHSRFSLLYQLLDAVGRAVDVHRNATPHTELLERLRGADDEPIVAILDEADQLDDVGVLYDLWRIPHLHLVLIANREADLFARLDDRLQSRLRVGRRIHFDRYATAEIFAILERRAELGLARDAWTADDLARIAEHAAGDARVAIELLHQSARLAAEREQDALSGPVIDDAAPTARHELRQRTISTLNHHQRVLFEVVSDAGEIAPGDLYDRYRDRVDDDRSDRTLRRYLDKMEQYDLVTSDGETRGRRYRPT